MVKRYRIWFKSPKFSERPAIGVGNTKSEALKDAKEKGRIGNKKVKTVTLASR
jgi:hypothetical protein